MTTHDKEGASRIALGGLSEAALTALFTTTIALSAGLLFLIEPIYARMILPSLGGAPSTWNTCLLFFQTALLAGYVYVHLGAMRLPPRLQLALHTGLMGAVLLLLPVREPIDAPLTESDPRAWLLKNLGQSVGLPFFALSTTAPLLQHWFSRGTTRDPYFLYAASNVGSLVGLLSYPFVIERTLTLRQQRIAWSFGMAIVAALIAVCGASTLKASAAVARSSPDVHGSAAERRSRPFGEQMLWLVLSFLPSSLLLGVTTHISTDVAAVPLLWVVPLAIYLGTFVVAFAETPLVPRLWAIRVMPIAIVIAVVCLILNVQSPLSVAAHLLAFTAVALVCHRELAERRPHIQSLTRFYLWVSLGGALGGLFNALVAPVLFSQVIEYPLGLLLAAIVRPGPRWRAGRLEPRFMVFALPALALLTTGIAAAVGVSGSVSAAPLIVAVGLCAALALAFANRTMPFAAAIGVVMLAHFAMPHQQSVHTIFTTRTFFGTHRVTADAAQLHRLFHGTTLHGWQRASQRESCEPTSYYHRTGPIGQVFTALGSRVQSAALIGLGAGALACYGRADTSFTFYEIDPVVERIARDPSLFTFLTNAQGALKVVIGDGRITLGRAAPEAYDLVVVDAFSSDAIPVHLMTREFVAMALARLRTNGLIAFHISNQHFDLGPTLGAAAAALGTAAIEQYQTGDSPDAAASRWLLIGKDAESLAVVGRDARWRPVRAAARGWTDDFSNILDVLRWSPTAAAGVN